VRTEAGLSLPQYPVTDDQGRFEIFGLPGEQIEVEFIDGKRWRCGSLHAGVSGVVLTAAAD
jgi:hypothetical protein